MATAVLEKAFKAVEQEKWVGALSIFSALSDYPEAALDYEANEQRIAKALKTCYKSVQARQAVSPFLQIQSDNMRI